MRILKVLNSLILILAIIESSAGNIGLAKALSYYTWEHSPVEKVNASSTLRVSLKTPTGASISFKSTKETNMPTSQERKIPHLVLKRNGVLTPGFERTLLLTLENMQVPHSGLFVDLSIETRHGNPDIEGKRTKPIPVWQETKYVPYHAGQLQSLEFSITFQKALETHHQTFQTPTDYFSYRLTVFDRQGEKLEEIHEEYAFLMENQWQVPLPEVLEDTPGAAPNKLLVYYCDMIPFQTNLRDPYTRLSRSEVERYVQTELIPAMVNAFVMQTNLWQMPWYAEWTNYRTDEDPKTLSVALGENGTWFHGTSPSLGHAMITIRVDGTFGEYATPTDGILSVFHHELFHNQQRNISLHFGSHGYIQGREDAWQLFSEGTAVLASAVAQPEIQFERVRQYRSYMKRANAFLGSEGMVGGSLNKPYGEIPYQTAMYWRFLYEHCGGLSHGQEDPATGMQVIRRILETLYRADVVDIQTSTDVASFLPKIVDHALQNTASCEFKSFQESLNHFANAIYLLRMEDGRCKPSSDFSTCGFFDPNDLYNIPDTASYSVTSAAALSISDSIPSSYGIDLIEMGFDPSVDRESLRITFESISKPEDEFNIEVWKIKSSDRSSYEHATRIDKPISIRTKDGAATLVINLLDVKEFEGLGLIITRVDPHEQVDPLGEYSIQALIQ